MSMESDDNVDCVVLTIFWSGQDKFDAKRRAHEKARCQLWRGERCEVRLHKLEGTDRSREPSIKHQGKRAVELQQRLPGREHESIASETPITPTTKELKGLISGMEGQLQEYHADIFVWRDGLPI